MAWHDDVIKWKHFPRYWPFVRGIHRSPRNFDVFFDLNKRWVNNREAGDLRRHHAHYDVTVMETLPALFHVLFCCQPKQAIEQTVELPVIWNAMARMWRQRFMTRHLAILSTQKTLKMLSIINKRRYTKPRGCGLKFPFHMKFVKGSVAASQLSNFLNDTRISAHRCRY